MHMPITSTEPPYMPPEFFQPKSTPGRQGSDERLAVLMFLATAGEGASSSTMIGALGLHHDTLRQVLTRLQHDRRIDCDKRGPASLWFVPHARAQARKQSGGAR